MLSRENIDDLIDYIKKINCYELVSCLYTLEQQAVSLDVIKKEILLEIKRRLAQPEIHEVIKKVLNEARREKMKHHFFPKLKYYYNQMLILMQELANELAENVKAIIGEYITDGENERPIYMKIQHGELLGRRDIINLQKRFTPIVIHQLLPYIITANANARTLNILQKKKNDSVYAMQMTVKKAFTSLNKKHEHNKKTDIDIIRKYQTPTSAKIIEILDFTISLISCLFIIGIGVTFARMHDSYVKNGHLRFWQYEPKINKVEKLLYETKPRVHL